MAYKEITYKEFKKEVEKLGAICKFYENVYVIYHNTVVATIFRTHPHHGVILFQILNDTESKLLNLCCKLMQRPLKNRGEIKWKLI